MEKQHFFNITKEDLYFPNGKERGFSDSDNCPFQAAFLRQFPEYVDKNTWAGIHYIYPHKNMNGIAYIDRGFDVCKYNDLLVDGIEFETTIHFL